MAYKNPNFVDGDEASLLCSGEPIIAGDGMEIEMVGDFQIQEESQGESGAKASTPNNTQRIPNKGGTPDVSRIVEPTEGNSKKTSQSQTPKGSQSQQDQPPKQDQPTKQDQPPKQPSNQLIPKQPVDPQYNKVMVDWLQKTEECEGGDYVFLDIDFYFDGYEIIEPGNLKILYIPNPNRSQLYLDTIKAEQENNLLDTCNKAVFRKRLLDNPDNYALIPLKDEQQLKNTKAYSMENDDPYDYRFLEFVKIEKLKSDPKYFNPMTGIFLEFIKCSFRKNI